MTYFRPGMKSVLVSIRKVFYAGKLVYRCSEFFCDIVVAYSYRISQCVILVNAAFFDFSVFVNLNFCKEVVCVIAESNFVCAVSFLVKSFYCGDFFDSVNE